MGTMGFVPLSSTMQIPALLSLLLIPLALADSPSHRPVFTAFHHNPAPTYQVPPTPPPTPAPTYHAPTPAPTYHEPAPTYQEPEPAYHAPEPAYHAPEPAYHAPAPAYHAPAPTYHAPECSVEDEVLAAEVCTPTLAKKCTKEYLAKLAIVKKEQCVSVSRTVCTESYVKVDNEICTYSCSPKTVKTTGKTVEITFKKECQKNVVSVCEPAGYGGYGHNNYCTETYQETCYNTPVLTPVEPSVEVSYPEPKKTCVNKPIDLPQVRCGVVSSKKCFYVPDVETVTVDVEKCTTGLGAPTCQGIELTLPKQVCKQTLQPAYCHPTSTYHA